jgi:low temperature requirement protein LtrA
MWWIYFAAPQHRLITGLRTGMFWGYGHFFIFAAAGAIAAGFEVALQVATHPGALDPVRTALTYTVPAGLYAFMVWLLIVRRQGTGASTVIMPVIAGLIVASALGPWPMQVTAGLLVLLAVARTRSTRSVHH